MSPLSIVLLEPYLTGSHAAWAREYQRHSRHRLRILGLEGRHWKWRMHGAAVTLARQFLAEDLRPDIILASDMLDLACFLALTRRRTARIPAVLYFHENQLSYPWSPTDKDTSLRRDAHYAFINFSSALAADMVLFNSDFHRHDFLTRLPAFLKSFPDHNEPDSVTAIQEKSRTLYLGLDLRGLDATRPPDCQGKGPPLLLWNHRWEYDKNPQDFFHALFALQERDVPFRLAVLGEKYPRQPPIFAQARERLADHIVQWGFVEEYADYGRWLWQADILPVTSCHDFFGRSVVQAIYCRCQPLLPRRLAYPEHIPPPLRQSCLYDDPATLPDRLEQLVRQGCPGQSDTLRHHVRRYDWQHMAPQYDELLSRL